MSKFGWAHVEGTHAKGVSGSVQYKDGELQTLTGSERFVFREEANAEEEASDPEEEK